METLLVFWATFSHDTGAVPVSGRGLDCYTVSFTATWPGSAKIYSAQRYETVNGLAVGRKQTRHCIIPS